MGICNEVWFVSSLFVMELHKVFKDNVSGTVM